MVFLVAGCNLYFDDDGGDDDCPYFEPVERSVWDYRNPATGACELFPGCDPKVYLGDWCTCAAIDAAPPPDWGACFSTCEALAEGECIETAGCIAAYLDPARVPPEFDRPAFQGCWAIAPSGPAPGGCANLDAYECSRHDNCSAIYTQQLGPDDSQLGMTFDRCVAEQPGACAGIDCGPDAHCRDQCSDAGCHPVCVPDGDACALIDCEDGYECELVCDENDPTQPGCGTCRAACVASTQCEALPDEATCAARADCSAVYGGMSCTCDANGQCTCQILTYERCEQR